MDNNVIPVRFGTESFKDNLDLRYALKHKGDGLKFRSIWKCDQFRDDVLINGGWEPKPNIFTTEGMAYLQNIIFGTTSKTGAEIWYVGIFKGNVTPALGDTGAAALGSGGTFTECQDPGDFDNASAGGVTASTGDKPAYDTVNTATAVITNSAAAAQFTMNASITVYGGFLSNVADCATPGSAVLMCAKKFAASRAVIADDVLAVTIQITASSS